MFNLNYFNSLTVIFRTALKSTMCYARTSVNILKMTLTLLPDGIEDYQSSTNT